MKLIRFGEKGNEKPGVELAGKRLDCSTYFKDWNREFFLNGGMSALQNIVKDKSLKEIPETVRWANPIARPGIIMCVGLNYSDHAKES